MRNIKIIISYDGSKFKGWQRLDDKKRTVQATVEKILSDILKEEVQVVGCGRTDAGVHALEYVLNVHVKSEMPVKELGMQMEKRLPVDIRRLSVKDCGERFHARYNVKQKTYLYKIDIGKQYDLFSRHYKMHVPERLDLEKMMEVARFLEGEHDFQSFTTLKAKNKSTVRTIDRIGIEKEGKDLLIRVSGQGFLWNMVRILVGTLLEVGKGNLGLKDVEEIMEKKVRAEAPGKVEAKALYLEKVEY